MACERWVSESEADFRAEVLLFRYANKRNGLAELDRGLLTRALIGLDMDTSHQVIFDAMHEAFMDKGRKTSIEDIEKAKENWKRKLSKRQR